MPTEADWLAVRRRAMQMLATRRTAWLDAAIAQRRERPDGQLQVLRYNSCLSSFFSRKADNPPAFHNIAVVTRRCHAREGLPRAPCPAWRSNTSRSDNIAAAKAVA